MKGDPLTDIVTLTNARCVEVGILELAREVAMSRTSFALRFKSVVGVAPAHVSTELAHALCGAGAA